MYVDLRIRLRCHVQAVLTRKNVVPVGLDTPRSSVDVSRQGSSEGTRDQQANVILANMADQADYVSAAFYCLSGS